MRLLLVEDDHMLASGLLGQLKREGFSVDWAPTLKEAATLGKHEDYAAAILDLGLPDGSGLDLLRQWRSGKKDLPVLILTARATWQEKVGGLKAGADDYLAKPFQTEELIARINTILRRSQGRSEAILKAGGFELDENRQALKLPNGDECSLTGTEFRLLRCIMSRPGQIFSKEQLKDQLYGFDENPGDNVIEAYILRLRKLVGTDAIVTRRGQGYLFNDS